MKGADVKPNDEIDVLRIRQTVGYLFKPRHWNKSHTDAEI
jgi:hypothetical protein